MAAGARIRGVGRLLPVLGVNAVPVVGVFFEEWSAATALSLYWCENVLGSLLVALRILVHRAATRKRGHQRQQLSLAAHNARDEGGRPGGRGRGGHSGKLPGSFLGEYVRLALGATAVHGLLLWFLLRKVLDGEPELAQLRNGVVAMAAFQILGFALDLVGIRRRPFAWVREVADSSVRRVNLIHLTLIVGAWVTLSGDGEGDFFGPFTVLKALADVGSALAAVGLRADPEEAPRWLSAVMNRLSPGRDFAAHWRERKAGERRLFEEDEEVMPARGSARRG
jgi:hypothetical protein